MYLCYSVPEVTLFSTTGYYKITWRKCQTAQMDHCLNPVRWSCPRGRAQPSQLQHTHTQKKKVSLSQKVYREPKSCLVLKAARQELCIRLNCNLWKTPFQRAPLQQRQENVACVTSDQWFNLPMIQQKGLTSSHCFKTTKVR